MYFLCRYAGSLQSCNICFCIATDWSISFTCTCISYAGMQVVCSHVIHVFCIATDWSISFTCTCISYAGMQVVCSHVIYVFVLLLIGPFHLHVHVFHMQVCR